MTTRDYEFDPNLDKYDAAELDNAKYDPIDAEVCNFFSISDY